MRQGTLVTPPAVEPIDLTTLKEHMRVDFTDSDTLLNNYITAAREYVEESYDRALVNQTWDFSLDAFPWDQLSIELPIWPLQSVTTVTYYDNNNNPTVWSQGNYFVDSVSRPGRIVLGFGQGWPAITLRQANAVVIRYVAGYGSDATLVPWRTKVALMMLVDHWYENNAPIIAERGVTPQEIPFAIRALLSTNEVAGVS